MKCDLCSREDMTTKELEMHKKVFHKKPVVAQPTVAGVCPDCGGTLIHEGGCIYCHSCGYSKC